MKHGGERLSGKFVMKRKHLSEKFRSFLPTFFASFADSSEVNSMCHRKQKNINEIKHETLLNVNVK